MLSDLLLVDKEIGWTSQDVVGYLKNRLQPRPKKIGHAGTLDPFATGLLLIMLNSGTKKFDDYQTLKKEYIAEIEFGKETDTYDITGQITKVFGGKVNLDLDKIKVILSKNFSGKILQRPPAYSAIKVGGVRSYDLARRGKGVEIKKREVEIYGSEILKIENNVLTLRLLVSSGTYIRTIGYDLGVLLEYGAFLKSLRRTKIGEYGVENARLVKEIVTG